MANFIFNIAKGRAAEFHHRVDQNDPANSALIIVAIVTTEVDDTLGDLDTLALVLANGNTAEATNGGYARKTLTDADLAALSPDDANNWMELDFADSVFVAIVAGDNWTDMLVCYDNDTTGGDDTNIVPISQHDFAVTPDGNDINLLVDANGWFRAP